MLSKYKFNVIIKKKNNVLFKYLFKKYLLLIMKKEKYILSNIIF